VVVIFVPVAKVLFVLALQLVCTVAAVPCFFLADKTSDGLISLLVLFIRLFI
jgi:hypothetical protein